MKTTYCKHMFVLLLLYHEHYAAQVGIVGMCYFVLHNTSVAAIELEPEDTMKIVET